MVQSVPYQVEKPDPGRAQAFVTRTHVDYTPMPSTTRA